MKSFVTPEGTRHEFPENWNELTRLQLIRVCKALTNPHRSQDWIDLEIMRAVVDVDAIIDEFQAQKEQFDYETITHLIEAFGDISKFDVLYLDKCNTFLFENKNIVSVFSRKHDLTQDTLGYFELELPTAKTKWYQRKKKKESIRFCGPGHLLNLTTFAEWIYADQHLHAYLNTKDEMHLNRLVAALYRPEQETANERGDLREKFSQPAVDRNLYFVTEFPRHIKSLIFLFFVSCKKKIVELYSGDNGVFCVPEKYPSEYKNIEAFNWTPHVFSLAKTNIWSGVQDVENELFSYILEHLLDEANDKHQK